MSHQSVFESEVMVHVPEKKIPEWNEKSERCIFIGYNVNSKAYRMYNVKPQDIAVSRNVILLKESQVTPRKKNLTQEARFEMVVKNEMEVTEEQVVNGAGNDL